MPHAISDVETKSHDLPGYSWVESKDSSRSMTRGISNGERMFVILNRDMYGQNCPFLGAHISLQGRDHSSKLKPFNISQLHARATKAFYQTRWKYPTVAGHLVDDDKFSYNIESGDEVGKWADRTVFTICQDEGWAALRERLSRESSLPTSDGDCCLIYLIVQPDETIKPELKSFDILMHMHHAFTDGSGIRVILNEFIERLADPLPDQEILWGKETQRLFPAAVLLEKIEEPEVVANTELAVVGGNHMNGVIPKADVGLPIYRPEIPGRPMPEHRGTLFVSHTFEDRSFLPQLLQVGRKHGVKLTGVLHAAMLKAVYDSSEIKPSSEDAYSSGTPMDLRNGWLIPEYCDRAKYVNSAIGLQVMNVPCKLFQTEESDGDGVWKAATYINSQWEVIKNKRGLVRSVESHAGALIDSWTKKNPSQPRTVKPRTCPTFSSDPPGSQAFRGTYPISGDEGLSLVLDSYQLATDQNQYVVSARSHSYNGLLTLCLIFNALRNPKDKMQELLDKWVEIVQDVGNDSGVIEA